jgi:hypothetical protein
MEMKTHLLCMASIGAFAFVAGSTFAAPVKLSKAQMDQVVAGWDYCVCCNPPPTAAKGNNGWGNGADPTNPGSFHGATSPSKIANASVPSAGKINTNPTNSAGR